MTYRIVLQPDGNLGVFNDAADTWVDQALGDEDAVDLLHDAERIDPDEIRTMIRRMRGRNAPRADAGYFMTREEAGWRAATAQGLPAGNRPLEYDRKGDRIRRHGLSGYARGCRCDTCLQRGGEHAITHGANGYAQGCRCDICLEAGRAGPHMRGAPLGYAGYLAGCRCGRCTAANDRRGPEDDRRSIPRTVMISPTVEALIEREAGTGAFGPWVWTAILEKLERDTGYADTTRRAAPRRANRQREEGRA